jgi:hypothetical protein
MEFVRVTAAQPHLVVDRPRQVEHLDDLGIAVNAASMSGAEEWMPVRICTTAATPLCEGSSRGSSTAV